MMMAAHWPLWDAALPGNLVRGGVLMSGLYDLDPILHTDFVNVDLKLDPASALKLSSGRMPQSHPTPFITSVGDLESEEFKRQTALISSQWQAMHRGEVALDGYNHLTICDAFGDPAHPLFEATCGLLASV
jgi:arylformamidase